MSVPGYLVNHLAVVLEHACSESPSAKKHEADRVYNKTKGVTSFNAGCHFVTMTTFNPVPAIEHWFQFCKCRETQRVHKFTEKGLGEKPLAVDEPGPAAEAEDGDSGTDPEDSAPVQPPGLQF